MKKKSFFPPNLWARDTISSLYWIHDNVIYFSGPTHRKESLVHIREGNVAYGDS